MRICLRMAVSLDNAQMQLRLDHQVVHLHGYNTVLQVKQSPGPVLKTIGIDSLLMIDRK